MTWSNNVYFTLKFIRLTYSRVLISMLFLYELHSHVC